MSFLFSFCSSNKLDILSSAHTSFSLLLFQVYVAVLLADVMLCHSSVLKLLPPLGFLMKILNACPSFLCFPDVYVASIWHADSKAVLLPCFFVLCVLCSATSVLLLWTVFLFLMSFVIVSHQYQWFLCCHIPFLSFDLVMSLCSANCPLCSGWPSIPLTLLQKYLKNMDGNQARFPPWGSW